MTQVKKYSLIVRRLKIVLPTMAAMLLVLIFVWPGLFTKIEDPIQFVEDKNKNDSLALVRLSFRMFDEQQKAMLVTADSAKETAVGSKLFQLKRLDAEMLMNKSMKIDAKADSGLLDQSKQILDVQGNIAVKTSSRHDIKTQKATIDFRKKTIDSDTDVIGKSPLGKINAQGFLIFNKGDEIMLKRNYRIEVDGSQKLDLGFGKSDANLVITGNDAITWRKLSRSVKANGGVMAVKGDAALDGDSITVYYDENNQITRLNADGNVRLTAEHNKAFGGQMAYDIIGDTLMLEGKPARIVTPQDTITADVITYKPQAGQAFTDSKTVLARQGTGQISANRMSLQLEKNAAGRTDIKSATAEGKITLKTDNESATGDRMAFDGRQGKAVLSGNIVLKRGKSVLRGSTLNIDMNTGETRLDADSGQQVQGQFAN